MINWDKCPDDIRDSLKRYIYDYIPTGSFLEAVLANDLYTAIVHADPVNIIRLDQIVRFITNEFPRNAYGSYDIVKKYLKGGGHVDS